MKHYKRLLNHGDPLGGRTPNGEAAKFFHEVVLTYTGDDCLIWPYTRTTEGYPRVRLDGVDRYVHRLVCEAAHGVPPSAYHEAAHGCGRGSFGCVTRRHLRWATSAENKADRTLHGTDNRGERCGTSKLTSENIKQIRRSGRSTRELAAEFGVSIGAVQRAKRGSSWRHIDV